MSGVDLETASDEELAQVGPHLDPSAVFTHTDDSHLTFRFKTFSTRSVRRLSVFERTSSLALTRSPELTLASFLLHSQHSCLLFKNQKVSPEAQYKLTKVCPPYRSQIGRYQRTAQAHHLPLRIFLLVLPRSSTPPPSRTGMETTKRAERRSQFSTLTSRQSPGLLRSRSVPPLPSRPSRSSARPLTLYSRSSSSEMGWSTITRDLPLRNSSTPTTRPSIRRP